MKFAWIMLSVLAILAVPLVALAQGTAPVFPDITMVLAAFVNAIKAGQWPVVAVLVLVGLIWLLRTFGSKWIPWLGTSEGGTVLAFLTAIGATLGAAALGGVPITWALVGAAISAGFLAMGAWTGVRRMLKALAPAVAKIPKVGPFLAQIMVWLSGGGDPAPVPTPGPSVQG